MLCIKSSIYLTGQAISNDQNSKFQTMFRPERFWSLNIGIWDLPARALQWQAGLFGIWCLGFVILDTKLQGRAGYLWPGPKDQVFRGKIKLRVKEGGLHLVGRQRPKETSAFKTPSFSLYGCFPCRYQRKKKPFKLLKLEGLHPVYLTLIIGINIQHPVSPQRDEYMLRQVFWLPAHPSFCAFPPG